MNSFVESMLFVLMWVPLVYFRVVSLVQKVVWIQIYARRILRQLAVLVDLREEYLY